MISSTWPRYLLWMLATLLGTIALCGTFNAFIDPLGIFGAPRIAGINATKPYLDHHRDLARWRAAQRICPSAGIFGNSRAEIGFDPEHPAFRTLGLEAFNHAIPGTPVAIAVRQLNWLRSTGCTPKVIILGVEFFDFLGSPPARTQTSAIPPAPGIDANVLAETVFSITALRDAVSTIAAQQARYPASISPRGFNPLFNYVAEVERSGHYALFHQRAVENLRNWSGKPRRIHPPGGLPSVEFAEFETFLATAAMAADTVHVVIYPYHAQIRLMMERADLNDLFTAWKASILATTRKVASAKATFSVWDFSGLGRETQERIPPPGDRTTHLTYYWEAGHFKKALGDRMLGQILLGEAGFGIPLDERTLDRWLVEDRKRVRDALINPSPLLHEVDLLFEKRPGKPPHSA